MLGSYLYHSADLLIEGTATVHTFIHVILTYLLDGAESFLRS